MYGIYRLRICFEPIIPQNMNFGFFFQFFSTCIHTSDAKSSSHGHIYTVRGSVLSALSVKLVFYEFKHCYPLVKNIMNF